MSASKLYAAGFKDLVSVIPPDAKLSSRSKISPDQRGKTPGKMNRSGTWGGYPWLETSCAPSDPATWDAWGNNVGIKAAHFPGIDIDVAEDDGPVAKDLADIARKIMGKGPVRLSRAPRILLVYRTTEPFQKLVLKFEKDGVKRAIEILGNGQQYLVHGKHPKGALYRWLKTPLWEWDKDDIPFITKEMASAYLDHATDYLRGLGFVCEHSGSIAATGKAAVQNDLKAPSEEALSELVTRIPNPAENGWDDMVKMGCAIKAASVDFPFTGEEAFLDWCSRWEGDGDNDDDTRDRNNWDSFKPPFRVGWQYLRELADDFGHNTAADDFEADPNAVPESVTEEEKPKNDSWEDAIGERNDALHRLNTKYAVAQVGGDSIILQEQIDGVVQFMKLDSFHLMHANWFVPDAQQPFKTVPATKEWIKWVPRRTYDRVVFMPGVEDDGSPSTILNPKPYNLWRGWAIQPSESGSCDLFMRHLLNIVCSGDRAHTKWLLDWMAHIFQFPMQKPGTVVGFQGRQGAGKSIVGATLKELLGRHHLLAEKPDHVIGRFNKHLADCLLLQAEEAFWGGSKAAAGTLKHLVTGTHMMVERKGIDSVEMENYTRLLITSNEDQLWPTSIDDRRLAVFKVRTDRAEDHTYFNAMLTELRNGGYAKLLHVLLNRSINLDALRKPPVTEALLAHASEGMGPEETWLLRLLTSGEVQGELGEDGRIRVTAAALYDDYVASADKSRFKKTEEAFGFFVREHLKADKTGNRIRIDTRLRSGVRSLVLVLPPLSVLRAAYTARGRGAAREWDSATWTAMDAFGEPVKKEAA